MVALHRTVALALLVLTFLCIEKLVAADKVHTSVKNRLGNGQSLSLHCQSKDNDLGQQSVADGGEFGWDFSVNVWGSTLFFCDMSWGNVTSFHFNAFDFHRDYVRCHTECLWLASEEGMYALNGQTGFWEYAYQWSI